MRIRQMTPGDVSAVAAIEKECFSRPWSEAAFADAVKDTNAVFLVAEAVQESAKTFVTAGYAGMYVSSPEGEITNVAVAEKFRNQGTGKKLVEAMKQWAKEHGLERIVLEVRSSNEPARHVYQSAGFVRLGIRKNFYQFPREDADIMECVVSRQG